MSEQPAFQPDVAPGEALVRLALATLAEARVAFHDKDASDTIAVHNFRKAMKRWGAVLRLVGPSLGQEAQRLRIEARDLSLALAPARDARSALDALADLGEGYTELSPRSLAAIRARLEGARIAAESTSLATDMRARIDAALAAAAESAKNWPLTQVDFADVAAALTAAYRRARRAVPDGWQDADAETLHRLRQRVVVHRYQMEFVEPLWPRLGRVWTGEAQRLRDRLGHYQDLAVLAGLTGLHQPLARWQSRLVPLIAARQAKHVKASARIAGRLFAEAPKAFRRRMIALWERRSHSNEA